MNSPWFRKNWGEMLEAMTVNEELEIVVDTQGKLGQKWSTSGVQTPGSASTGFLHVLVLENGHFGRVFEQVANRQEIGVSTHVYVDLQLVKFCTKNM